MAVHPQRFEMSLPRWMILFFYKLIPKADYTFFLYCTPEEIHQRKQEFTKEEIKVMTDEYLKVGKSIKNFIPIHTNTSIEEEIDEILTHISK
jgi:thymidylate kinase